MATRRVHLCRGGLLNGHRGLSPAIGPEGFRHHQLEEVASNPTVGNQLNLEMTDSRWPAQIGALEPTEDGKPHRLIFDTEAQQRFTLWRDDLERRVRDTDLSSIMKSVLAKQRGLIPRLAALIHLSSGGVNPVQLPALTLAMAWGQFLEAHARYLFSSVRDSDSKAARVLAEHITAEKLGQTFKRRDLQLKTWAGLDSPKTIDGALSRLM